MKNIVGRFAVSLFLLALVGTQAFAQVASTVCSASKLRGTYTFKMDGLNPGNTGFAAVGLQTFDGRGGFSTVNTISVGGSILNGYSFTGTYTVNPDCSGTMTANFGGGMTSTGYFVATQNGRQLYTITADPGAVVTGVFTKQVD